MFTNVIKILRLSKPQWSIDSHICVYGLRYIERKVSKKNIQKKKQIIGEPYFANLLFAEPYIVSPVINELGFFLSEINRVDLTLFEVSCAIQHLLAS